MEEGGEGGREVGVGGERLEKERRLGGRGNMQSDDPSSSHCNSSFHCNKQHATQTARTAHAPAPRARWEL